ncbi:hypothetical protein [Niallia taxi]|uniref:hypothetical protein n=1 Tax=Niallia taxi TaxID=2499688 RepID=UPI002E2083AF|nr:hypothetical protein [Niallia taxi]
MSLATYIGCNIELPINDVDEGSDEFFYIYGYFADELNLLNVKNHQFNTPYIYEISGNWGIEISPYMNPKRRAKSQKNLMKLFEIMDTHISNDDFFELYSCWVGEEAREREGEITLHINNFDIDQIEIPEQTLVRFVK